MTHYSMALFAMCSSPACGNVKSEGDDSARNQETFCSPKWDTGTLIMETRSRAGKPIGTSLVILITAACHLG